MLLQKPPDRSSTYHDRYYLESDVGLVLVIAATDGEVVGCGRNGVSVEVVSISEVNANTDVDFETKKDVAVSSSGTDTAEKMVEVTVLSGSVSTPRPGPCSAGRTGNTPVAARLAAGPAARDRDRLSLVEDGEGVGRKGCGRERARKGIAS
ncbi:hypothetical protein LY76DRAFT_601330 [Colletotrichum caudatum]|nr:hypothetical protein LY76DRAFT_601330 [Colletotrichum caudatum]